MSQKLSLTTPQFPAEVPWVYTGDESQGEQDKATEGEQSGQSEEEEEGKRKEGDEKNVIGCEMHGSILVSFTDSTPLWDIWTTVLKA